MCYRVPQSPRARMKTGLDCEGRKTSGTPVRSWTWIPNAPSPPAALTPERKPQAAQPTAEMCAQMNTNDESCCGACSWGEG